MVDYAGDSHCEGERASGWKVPAGTVITIAVYFKGSVPLSRLGVNLGEFKKIASPELPDLFYYRSDKEGINIEAANDYANSIAYYPPEKDWHLMCPKDAPNKSINRTRN
jgi:hypothetical protein